MFSGFLNKSSFVLLLTFALDVCAWASVLPGEESNQVALLGLGYNSIKGEVAGKCVKLGPLETQSGSKNSQLVRYNFDSIESESELRTKLNISAEASFKGFGASGSARMRFAETIKKNQNNKYLLIHVQVQNALEIATQATLLPEAHKLLINDPDMFFNVCGDEYFEARRTGGELFALVTVEMLSSQEDRQFSAAMSGSGWGYKAKAEIDEEIAKFSKFTHTKVDILMVGANGDVQTPSINGLSEFSRSFNTLVSHLNGASWPLELFTKSYAYADPLDKRACISIEFQKEVLNHLANLRDYGKEILNTIKYVKKNQNSFIIQQNLDAKEMEFSEYLNKIYKLARNCQVDAINGCAYPDFPMPNWDPIMRKDTGTPYHPNFMSVDDLHRMIENQKKSRNPNFMCVDDLRRFIENI